MYMKKNEKKGKKELVLDDKTLDLYNKLSFICGLFSIILTLTGIFGIILGFLGICLSVTYYTQTKKIRLGYILSIIGSLLSAIFLVLQLCIFYGTFIP